MLTAALAASIAGPALPVAPVPPVAPIVSAAPATVVDTPASPTDTVATPAPAAAVPVVAATPAPAAAPVAGEIVVSGEHKLEKLDPVMAVNKASFAVTEGVDKALVGPAAHIYRDVLPHPVRQGLHNFFYNLTEPTNALNYLLQLHPREALRTVARFGINSTIGIAGLIDVAQKKPFNIHYRPNGFANTMGYWGIGPGPYLFVPLVGPTTVRDLIGTLLDQAVLPTAVGKPFNNYYYVTSAGIITSLDYRVVIDEDLNKVRATSSPYSSYRALYLKTRYNEIEALHGRGPLAKGEVGMAPFAKPLYPETDAVAPAPVPAPPPPAAFAPPVITPIAQPVPPPAPMVFVSHPVIQPLPAGH